MKKALPASLEIFYILLAFLAAVEDEPSLRPSVRPEQRVVRAFRTEESISIDG